MQGPKSGDGAMLGSREEGQVLPGWWQQQGPRLGLRTLPFPAGLGGELGMGLRLQRGGAWRAVPPLQRAPGCPTSPAWIEDRGTAPRLIPGALSASEEPEPPAGLPKSGAKDAPATLCRQGSPSLAPPASPAAGSCPGTLGCSSSPAPRSCSRGAQPDRS